MDKYGHIKLIDFGFSKCLTQSKDFKTYTNCGTLGYTSPEILLNITSGYSFPVDIWSFGIFLCELTSGSIPFEHINEPHHVEDQIIKCEIKMPRDAEPSLRSLLSQILVLEPNLRLSIADIKKHRYFAEIDWEKAKNRKLEPIPYVPDPERYREVLKEEHEVISNL